MKIINKYIVIGQIQLVTPLHIGSGYMSSKTDATVIKDSDGCPIIPGSSLKGVIRTAAERLFHVLSEEKEGTKEVCYLIKGNDCNRQDKNILEDYNLKQGDHTELGQWLDDNICPICQLFGSNFRASKVSIKDASLTEEERKNDRQKTTVRHSVAIDRDKGTAKEGAKFDYEVVHKDVLFDFEMELDNVSTEELKLILVVLNEMSLERIQLGGNVARGLGRIKLINDEVKGFKFTNGKPKDKLGRKERSAYLRYILNNEQPDRNSNQSVKQYLSKLFPSEVEA